MLVVAAVLMGAALHPGLPTFDDYLRAWSAQNRDALIDYVNLGIAAVNASDNKDCELAARVWIVYSRREPDSKAIGHRAAWTAMLVACEDDWDLALKLWKTYT